MNTYIFTQNINFNNYCQSGFRPGFSCATALLGITDDIFRSIDRGYATALTLLVYSKASHNTIHTIPFAMLDFIGFVFGEITLVLNYLKNRFQ